MAVSARLKVFLTKSKIKYKSAKHPLAYTAQEIAASQHVSGKELAKCVVVNTERGCILAVLPAVQLVDLAKLKKLLKAKKLTLATEAQIKHAFPDVEVGAMSPFGNLYTVPVIVEKSLATYEDLVCNAGSHTDTVRLRYRDFEKAVKPRVALFGLAATKARRRK